MKRPDPEDLHRRTGQLLAAAQDIRTTAKREHAAADVINPETGAFVYGEDERRTKHAKIREQALKAIDGLGLRSLDDETAAAAAEADAYLSVDAILSRARFTPEPVSEEEYARHYPGRDSPSWNPIAEETRRRDREFGRTLADIRELMQRADAERNVARLDDAARAQCVKQATAENNLAMLRVLHDATNERSRLEGTKAVTKTRSALVTAFQTVNPGKFEGWLHKTVSEAEAHLRQTWAIRESLNRSDIPDQTVAERSTTVAAAAATEGEATADTVH